MKKNHQLLLIFAAILMAALVPNFCFAQEDTSMPPLCPRWAFEPWVWEDYNNTREGLYDLVNGYLNEDIPVGAVIIDSPWEKGFENIGGNCPTNPDGRLEEDFTQYNSFDWTDCRYPDLDEIVNILHKQDGSTKIEQINIKVIMWITGIVNQNSPLYAEVENAGFCFKDTIGNCELRQWWKDDNHTNLGSHIDFENEAARTWVHGRMDRLLDIEIDGWKCDRGADVFGDEVLKKWYYHTFYDFSKQRSPEAIIVSRAYSWQQNNKAGGFGASIPDSPISWQGDFKGNFEGLKDQMKDIYKSAEEGYGAPGVEIGGYLPPHPETKVEFIRYAQFGAMTPLMENGGQDVDNDDQREHLPWSWDEKDSIDPGAQNSTTSIYKFYATLHSELVPYIFSYSVEAHLTGESILRNIEKETDNQYKSHHKLGDHIFVSILTDNSNTKRVEMPGDGRWIDYWTEDDLDPNDEDHFIKAGEVLESYDVSDLKTFPIFIKVGAIIPMNVKNDETGHGDEFSKGKITLNIYPGGHSSFAYHHPIGDGIEYENILIDVDEKLGAIKINGDSSDEYIIRVKSFKRPTGVSIVGAENGITWDYNDQEDLIIMNATGTNFTITIDGMEGYGPPPYLITNLVVYDEENAVDWSIQKDLQSGDLQYGDRNYQFISPLPGIAESDRDWWIKTANDSKGYTEGILATFEVTTDTEVYIAHDDRISDKPPWLSGWEDTGEDLVNNEPITFSLYKKTFVSGAEVSLGPNKEGGCAICSMYTIIALPVSCNGDFDNDDDVDGANLWMFGADFGRTDCSGDCNGDFDTDGDVDESDLAVFATDFGLKECP